MAEYTRLQNSFAAGYVDPTLHGLTNSNLYNQGLMECHNYIPSSLGYLYRRPGTKYIGRSSSYVSPGRRNVRLCALKTNNGPMVVCFYEGSIDIWREGVETGYTIENGAQTDSGVSSVPWKGEELAEMDIYEYEGSLYIVHRNHRPHVIEHIKESYWNIYAENGDEATYTATVAGAVDMPLEDIRFSTGFNCLPVDFKLNMFTYKGDFPSCQTFKGGRWFLSGTDDNPATIYGSKAPDALGNYRFDDFRIGEYYLLVVNSRYVKTTIYTSTESEGSIVSVEYDSSSNQNVQPLVFVSPEDFIDYDVPADTSYDVVKRYTATGQETTSETETKRKTVTTVATTYAVKANVNPDDGIELTETDMYGSSVNWMLTQQRVIAGTDRSIWMDRGEAATPATFDMVQTLASTVAPVHPVQYGSMIIFVPGNRRGVRGFYYDDNAGGYSVVDISASARTLFKADVKEMAMCEGQETILWLLLTDGSLLSCTLGSAYGWASHNIGGDGFVESIVAYHDDDGSSSLFLAVNRRSGTRQWDTVEKLDLEDLVQTKVFTLMDCQHDVPASLLFDGTIEKTGLSEMFHGIIDEDTAPYVLHNGWAYPTTFEDESVVYAPGISSTEQGAPDVKIGYGYRSRAMMLWQELPAQSAQSSLGMKRKATSMLLQIYRSGNPFGGYWTNQSEKLEQLPRLVKGNAAPTYNPDLFSGLVRIHVPSNTDEMVHAVVQADEPLPMTVLAIETKYVLQEV